VPLLLGRDEMGRTQGGNNNAYCQDNEMTWYVHGKFVPAATARTREPGRCRHGKRREAGHGTRTHKRLGSPAFCAYRNFGAHRAGDFGESEMR